MGKGEVREDDLPVCHGAESLDDGEWCAVFVGGG
jgi:hypothetical protein